MKAPIFRPAANQSFLGRPRRNASTRASVLDDMRPEIDFWFDLTCPYAYIASSGIEALAHRGGAELRLQPFLLGGVFRARSVPQNLAGSLCSQKALHNANDLRDHAALVGIELTFPPEHPMRSVYALRAILATGEPYGPLMHAFYCAYWVEGVEISAPHEIEKVLRAASIYRVPKN